MTGYAASKNGRAPVSSSEWDAWCASIEASLERERFGTRKTSLSHSPTFQWLPIDSQTFAATDYRLEWLVKRVLVR